MKNWKQLLAQRFEGVENIKEIVLPVFLLSCSPKAMTGRAEAKNM